MLGKLSVCKERPKRRKQAYSHDEESRLCIQTPVRQYACADYALERGLPT